MNAKECMIEADKLLQKWSCYSIENRRYIEKIFNGSNRYDMMLNVDVMQKQAKKLICHHKGELVWMVQQFPTM